MNNFRDMGKLSFRAISGCEGDGIEASMYVSNFNGKNTDFYTQLLNFENDEWHVAHARNLNEENKLIEAGFEYVRYIEKDEVTIYRKRK